MRWDEMTTEEKHALVAEKVLGRKIFREYTWNRWMMHREDKPGLLQDIPRFTEHMDAAWQIVEKLMSDEIFYLQTRTSDAGRFYTAELYGGHSRCSHTSSVSMPDAICIAALCACGVRMEEPN